MRHHRAAAVPVLLALFAACADDPQAPASTGGIRVTVTVSGARTGDPFDLVVDDRPPQRLIAGTPLGVFGLAAGVHRVEILGLADNCVILDGNPRTVQVVADETVEIELHVACGNPLEATAIRVSVTIDGLELDDGFGVRLDGAESFRWMSPDEV